MVNVLQHAKGSLVYPVSIFLVLNYYFIILVINMSTSKLIKVTCSDINTNGCTSNLETEKLSCYCQSDHCNDPTSKQSSNDSVGNETKFDYGKVYYLNYYKFFDWITKSNYQFQILINLFFITFYIRNL